MKLQTNEETRVRIYTVPKVSDKLRGTYSGATLIPTEGFWVGVAEDAVIVEVVTDDMRFADDFVQSHARQAALLGEEAILVTVEPVQAKLVYTDQAWIESIR